jgi:hypothetical protein
MQKILKLHLKKNLEFIFHFYLECWIFYLIFIMGFNINDGKLFVPSKTIKLSNLVVFNLVAHIRQKQFDILKSFVINIDSKKKLVY